MAKLTKGDFLSLLTREAKRYRQFALASIIRNSHMNFITHKDIAKLREDSGLTQRFIDALLTDFVNTIGTGQGLDWGLYVKHFHKKS